MHDELVKRLRCEAETERYLLPHSDNGTAALLDEAADSIEKYHSQVESLCETIDLYRKLLGGHPDPRGEDGEPGVKCIDCQRDCQMIGLDMPACTAYEPRRRNEHDRI